MFMVSLPNHTPSGRFARESSSSCSQVSGVRAECRMLHIGNQQKNTPPQDGEVVPQAAKPIGVKTDRTFVSKTISYDIVVSRSSPWTHLGRPLYLRVSGNLCKDSKPFTTKKTGGMEASLCSFSSVCHCAPFTVTSYATRGYWTGIFGTDCLLVGHRSL